MSIRLRLCHWCVAGQHRQCNGMAPGEGSYACVCSINDHLNGASRAVMAGIILSGQEGLNDYLDMLPPCDSPALDATPATAFTDGMPF